MHLVAPWPCIGDGVLLVPEIQMSRVNFNFNRLGFVGEFDATYHWR